MRPKKLRSAVGALALTTALLAGCAQGDGPPGAPVVLDYWSWAPNIEKVVDVWNRSHPDVQVRVNTSTGGGEIVAKLTAAQQAGDLPDLSNATYESLPNLITSGIAADITDAMGGRQAQTAKPAWDMTTFDGVNYAVPQGTAPMFLYYRTDIFAEHGLTAPTTWDEYAATARALRAADPDTYLATFPANEAQLFAGLSQQAGAQWWSRTGDTWTVGIDDAPTRKVADFWQGLVDDGSLATFKSNTPEWQAALADGTLASLLGAVWTPPILLNNAPGTAGRWAAVPIPQWTPSDPVSGVLGGSATIVTPETEHPQEAREFALWLNTSTEAVQAYVQNASIWPAALPERELPELQVPPQLLPDQGDFYATAATIDSYTATVTWGPNVAVAYDAFINAVTTAVTEQTRFTDALAQVQDTVLADLDRSGYLVAGRTP